MNFWTSVMSIPCSVRLLQHTGRPENVSGKRVYCIQKLTMSGSGCMMLLWQCLLKFLRYSRLCFGLTVCSLPEREP